MKKIIFLFILLASNFSIAKDFVSLDYPLGSNLMCGNTIATPFAGHDACTKSTAVTSVGCPSSHPHKVGHASPNNVNSRLICSSKAGDRTDIVEQICPAHAPWGMFEGNNDATRILCYKVGLCPNGLLHEIDPNGKMDMCVNYCSKSSDCPFQNSRTSCGTSGPWKGMCLSKTLISCKSFPNLPACLE